MVRTQIQLTEKQAKLIKQIAVAEHLSAAELIRRGIDIFLNKYSTISMADRRRRALDIAGRFSSGTKDTAKNHDAYLVEAFEK